MKGQLGRKTVSILLIAVMTVCLTLCACSPAVEYDKLLSPKDPVCIYVWNYYNGDQKLAFDTLVNRFNSTLGREKGIVIEVSSQGNVDSVFQALLDSVKRKVGAQDLPDLVTAYSDMMYTLWKMDVLVDISAYFDKTELDAYLPGYLEEGRINDGLYSFPVSKSTEILLYNATDWKDFKRATGIAPESIYTVEDLVEAAEAYYLWTDSLTPDIPEDGRALFGRDAVDNYMIIGMKQLGHPAFKVVDGKVEIDLDRGALKTLWDNYYIPSINGYFGAYGKFRSDDTKTGRILSYIGSSSSASFFPAQVTRSDDSSYDIEAGVEKVPLFAEATERSIVQQGAGYCMVKTDERRQYAASIFLKWLTEDEQNTDFSVQSGYLPVKKDSLTRDNLEEAAESGEAPSLIWRVLVSSGEMVLGSESYASPPFEGATEARYALRDAMTNVCQADRATVEDKIAHGISREDAVKYFTTEEYFDAWYQRLNKNINEIVGR